MAKCLVQEFSFCLRGFAVWYDCKACNNNELGQPTSVRLSGMAQIAKHSNILYIQHQKYFAKNIM